MLNWEGREQKDPPPPVLEISKKKSHFVSFPPLPLSARSRQAWLQCPHRLTEWSWSVLVAHHSSWYGSPALVQVYSSLSSARKGKTQGWPGIINITSQAVANTGIYLGLLCQSSGNPSCHFSSQESLDSRHFHQDCLQSPIHQTDRRGGGRRQRWSSDSSCFPASTEEISARFW